MSLNYDMCWVKRNQVAVTESLLCDGLHREQHYRVTGCSVTLTGAEGELVPLTLHVWANVHANAKDESFGIRNVVVSKLKRGDYAGWVHDRRYWSKCLIL